MFDALTFYRLLLSVLSMYTKYTNRSAALTSGVLLVVLTVVAGFSFLVAVEGVLVEGDAAATAAKLADNASMVRIGAFGFFMVALIDVLLGFSLGAFFGNVDRRVANASAALRVVYGLVLAVAAFSLVGAQSAGGGPTAALDGIDRFNSIWDPALIVFGLHLVLIAWLSFKGSVPHWIASLVSIAGLGYIVDGIGTVVLNSWPFDVSTITFVGELILAIWLLARGGRNVVGAKGAAKTREVSDSGASIAH